MISLQIHFYVSTFMLLRCFQINLFLRGHKVLEASLASQSTFNLSKYTFLEFPVSRKAFRRSLEIRTRN